MIVVGAAFWTGLMGLGDCRHLRASDVKGNWIGRPLLKSRHVTLQSISSERRAMWQFSRLFPYIRLEKWLISFDFSKMALQRVLCFMGFKALSLYLLIFSSALLASGLVSATALKKCPCGKIEITFTNKNQDIPGTYKRVRFEQVQIQSGSEYYPDPQKDACYATFEYKPKEYLIIHYNRYDDLEKLMVGGNITRLKTEGYAIAARAYKLAVKCSSVEECKSFITDSVKEITRNFTFIQDMDNDTAVLDNLEALNTVAERFKLQKLLSPPGTLPADKQFIKELEVQLASYEPTTSTTTSTTSIATTATPSIGPSVASSGGISTPGDTSLPCPTIPCVCPSCTGLYGNGSAQAAFDVSSPGSTTAISSSGSDNWIIYVAALGWILFLSLIPVVIILILKNARRQKECAKIMEANAILLSIIKGHKAAAHKCIERLRERFIDSDNKRMKLEKDVTELSQMLRYSYNSGVKYDIALRQRILDAGGPHLELDPDDTQVSDDEQAAIMYKYKNNDDDTSAGEKTGATDKEPDVYAKCAWRAKASYRKKRDAELKEAHLKKCSGCNHRYHVIPKERQGKEATEYPIVPIVREVIPPNETKEQEEARKKKKEEARDRHRMRRRLYLEDHYLTKRRSRPETSHSRERAIEARRRAHQRYVGLNPNQNIAPGENMFTMYFRSDEFKNENQKASDGKGPVQKVPAPDQIKYKKMTRDRPKVLVKHSHPALVKRVVVKGHVRMPLSSRVKREIMALNGFRKKDRVKDKDQIMPDNVKVNKKTPTDLKIRAAFRARRRLARKRAIGAIRKQRRKAAIVRAKLRRAEAKKAGKNVGKKAPDNHGAAPAAKGAAGPAAKGAAGPAANAAVAPAVPKAAVAPAVPKAAVAPAKGAAGPDAKAAVAPAVPTAATAPANKGAATPAVVPTQSAAAAPAAKK